MNELAKIAEESGLPTTQSELLLGIFQEFLGVTAKWEEKAKNIKVTDESQTDMMLLAREGRKEMQQLRLKLDRKHKEQKQIPLLYGRAVDGMKNVLKLPIVELENYLQIQEDFVIIRERKAATARREEAERLLQEKEAAEDKVLEERLEKERLDSIKYRKVAEEEARVAQIEKDKAIEKAEKIEKQRRLEREAHQREIEQKQRENFEREEKIRVENKRKIAAENKKRDAENKEREEKAERRRRIGQNRLNLLYQIGAKADFDELANMSNEFWTDLLVAKTNDFKVANEKALLEKQRAEKEEEKKQKLAQEALNEDEKRVVSCPKCGHSFVPSKKLL